MLSCSWSRAASRTVTDRVAAGTTGDQLVDAIELLLALADGDALLAIDQVGLMLSSLPDHETRQLLGDLRASHRCVHRCRDPLHRLAHTHEGRPRGYVQVACGSEARQRSDAGHLGSARRRRAGRLSGAPPGSLGSAQYPLHRRASDDQDRSAGDRSHSGSAHEQRHSDRLPPGARATQVGRFRRLLLPGGAWSLSAPGVVDRA